MCLLLLIIVNQLSLSHIEIYIQSPTYRSTISRIISISSTIPNHKRHHGFLYTS